MFIRTWYPVQIPQYYNPVTSLLLPQDQKNGWTGMKTSGELRRTRGLKAEFSGDSVYKVATCTCVNVNLFVDFEYFKLHLTKIRVL